MGRWTKVPVPCTVHRRVHIRFHFTNCHRVDADVEFLRADIVDETIHQLQHHSVVQMFQHCLDMGPSGEILHTHSSFAYVDKTRQQFHPSYRPYAPGATFMHP